MEKYPYLSRKSLLLFIIKNESSMVKAEKNGQSAFMENTAALNTVAAVTYLSSVSYFTRCIFFMISICCCRKNVPKIGIFCFSDEQNPLASKHIINKYEFWEKNKPK